MKRKSSLLVPLVALVPFAASCGGGESGDVLARADVPSDGSTIEIAEASAPARKAPAISERPHTAISPEIAALIPKSTFLFAQISSIDAVDTSLVELSRVFGEEAPDGFRSLLGMMVMGDVSMIDGDKPVGIAVALFNVEEEPAPTLIVPVTRSDDFIATLMQVPGFARPVERDGYVAITLGPTYRQTLTVPEVVQQIPEGDFSLVVDIERLVELFRDEIEEGIAEMESELSTLSQVATSESVPGFDFDALASGITDGYQTFLDSAETLEMAVDFDASDFELYTAFRTKEGSPLAAWSSDSVADPGRFAGYLPTSDPVAILAAIDIAGMHERFRPFMESMLAMADANVKEEMEHSMKAFKALYQGFGDEMAVSMGLGESGLEMTYFFEAPHAEDLAIRYATVMERTLLKAEGMLYEGPLELEIDGVRVGQYRVQFDPNYVPENKSYSAEDVEEMRAGFEQVFGPTGLVFSIAGKDDVLMMVVGKNRAVFEAVRKLNTDPKEIPSYLGDSVDRVRGANPSFAFYLDLRKTMRQLFDFSARTFPGTRYPSADDMAGEPVPVLIYGALEGRTWYAGMASDLTSLGEFADRFMPQ